MKNFFSSVTVLSCSFIFVQSLSLHAQSMGYSPDSSSTFSPSNTATEVKKGGAQGSIAPTSDSKSAATTNKEPQNPDEMAGWILESSQIAKNYVEGIDQGNYSQSWPNGDELFQKTVSQADWTKFLDSNRKSLGKVKSRILKLQRPAWDPQGLPKGPYMVIEYDTSFENAPQATEILTLRRGPDSKWRILTYQIN